MTCEGERRHRVTSSQENYLKTHGHKPADGFYDPYEGASRLTEE